MSNNYTVPILLQLTLTSAPLTKTVNSNGNFIYPSCVFSVATQNYISFSTGKKSTNGYTGLDMQVGNWIAGGIGGGAWMITSITLNDTNGSIVTVTLEDIDNFSYYMYNGTGTGFPSVSNYFKTTSGANYYIYFTTGSDGQPILTPTFNAGLPSYLSNLPADIISRFAYLNPSKQYINLYQAGFNYPINTPIWLNTNVNPPIYQSSNSVTAAPYTIGIVSNINNPSPGNFDLQVFGTYYNNVNQTLYIVSYPKTNTIVNQGSTTIELNSSYTSGIVNGMLITGSSIPPGTFITINGSVISLIDKLGNPVKTVNNNITSSVQLKFGNMLSLITKIPGTFLYIDTSGANAYTTIKPSSNAVPIWVYLGPNSVDGFSDTGILYPGYGYSSGSSSTATSTTDPWLLTNLISQPPVPTFVSKTSSSTDIYVIVKPPTQTTLPILPTPLPVITTVSYAVNTLQPTTTLLSTTTQLTQLTTANIVSNTIITQQNLLGGLLTNNTINSQLQAPSQCIHFSTLTTNGMPSTYTDNGNSYPMLNYTLTTSQLNNSQLYIWYGNTSSNYPYNVLSIPISYTVPGAPGPFSVTSFTNTQTTNTMNPSISVQITTPIPDVNNPTTASPILTYIISYSEGVNTIRFPDKYIPSGNIPNPFTKRYDDTSTAILQPFIEYVYPDTQYTITNFSATNKSSLTTNATLPAITTITTPGFDRPNYVIQDSNQNFTLNITNSNLNAKSVNGGNTINLLTTNDSGNIIKNSSITFNVQNTFANRGINSGKNNVKDLVNISLNLNQENNVTKAASSSATIKGYSDNQINKVDTNTTTTFTLADQFANQGGQYQGYYQNVSVETTLTTNSIFNTASPDGYSLVIKGTYTLDNGNVSQTYTSNKFYYDGVQILSKPNLSSASIASANVTKICGIYVLNSNSSITLATTCSNIHGIGTYFYNPTIMTYNLGTFSTTTTETNPNTSTNVGSIVNNKIIGQPNPITFTRTNLSVTSTPTTYTISLPVSTTIYNAYSQTNSSDTISIPIIYDPNCFTNGNINYTSLVTIPQTFVPINDGYRVYSGTTVGNEMATPNNVLNNLTNAGSAYVATGYDHTKSLATDYTNELLYSNGYFQSHGANKGQGYDNYNNSNYYANGNTQPNYSTIVSSSSYRYCTFAWKITATSFSTAIFTLNDINGTSLTDSCGKNGIIGFEASPLYLYYRLEDNTNITNITSSNNTAWINGNNYETNGGITYTSLNANNVGSSGSSFRLTGITNTSNSILNNNIKSAVFNVSFSTKTFSTNNQILYCRVGLPMNSSSYFSSISVVLT